MFLYRYRLEKEETSDGHEALMQELTSVSVLFVMSVMCSVLILLRALVTVSVHTKLGYQDIQTDVAYPLRNPQRHRSKNKKKKIRGDV